LRQQLEISALSNKGAPALGNESPNQDSVLTPATAERLDSGLIALSLVAGFYRITADPAQIAHDLGLGQRLAQDVDLVRAAQRLGLGARIRRDLGPPRLRWRGGSAA
jgi:hypothetical protein